MTDAARELFSEHGFDDTTTDAIARRAGVAKGTLFFHARDKLELLMLVLHDDLRDTSDRLFLELPADVALRAQLLLLFGGLVDNYKARPRLSEAFLKRLFLAEGPQADRQRALTFTFLFRVGEVIAAAQRRGEVGAHVDPGVAASNAFSVYVMALFGWASGHLTWEGVMDNIARALDLQISGWEPRAVAPPTPRRRSAP
ncbi:MAG: TetR/AcrR family transcriptional regulator [Sandaracinaceae bacterium]|nr:TetR/AcrR family transcriptional regulator [Sandaracinaceae bacterium]